MTITVTKRLLSGNFAVGRPMPVDQIVIHVTEGSASSVREWFANPKAEVSAHYMVTVTGTVDQFVDEDNQAWHAGRVWEPTAPLVAQRPNVNPNAYSIGIEHEGDGTKPLTPPQLAASLSLTSDICARRKIPIDRVHIVGHHEVYAKKTCPGAINVDDYVRALRSVAFLPASRRPITVWSAYTGDWLIAVQVVSDNEWYYVPLSAIRRGIAPTKATTPLSRMPLVQP